MVKKLRGARLFGIMAGLMVSMLVAVACAGDTPTPIVKEVIKEVIVTPVPAAKETIVFAGLNWESAQRQNAIARFIVENGYGYPTDSIFGATVPLFQGLIKGDIDVTMEIWLPNQQATWDPALAKGQVIPVGKSLDDNWQSTFVVPTYVVEQNPDLMTAQDIRKYVDLFKTSESGGKANLVTCVAGWACEKVNAEKVMAYGLDDVVNLQVPGSDAALFASLEGAYAKKEPWLGYMWGPTKIAAELDLTILKEAECVGDAGPGTGCAYPTARVLIAVHPDMIQRAPEVVEFLRKWEFTATADVASAGYKADTGADDQKTALWFLQTQESVWTQWVTDDVAAKVKAALTAAMEG